MTGQASDGFIASLCLTASHASLWLNLGLKGALPSENDERLLDRSNSRFALCRSRPRRPVLLVAQLQLLLGLAERDSDPPGRRLDLAQERFAHPRR